jgi:hypothetical protein
MRFGAPCTPETGVTSDPELKSFRSDPGGVDRTRRGIRTPTS